MNSTQSLINQLRQLNDARTQGEWRTHPSGTHSIAICADFPHREQVVIADFLTRYGQANADFVALCSWVVPVLLDELQRAQEKIAQLEKLQDTLTQKAQDWSDLAYERGKAIMPFVREYDSSVQVAAETDPDTAIEMFLANLTLQDIRSLYEAVRGDSVLCAEFGVESDVK